METAQMLDEAEIAETISDYELERGKPMPSKLHSAIQTNIATSLKYNHKHRFKVLSELSIRLLGDKYVPDIALYDKNASDWREEEIEMTVPPLLAIEIESPSQSTNEMTEKAHQYLAAGVQSVWLVMPALGGIMLFHNGRKPRFVADGDLVDDVLDIRIAIDEVFE
jgi:Uma2 family endonuclease